METVFFFSELFKELWFPPAPLHHVAFYQPWTEWCDSVWSDHVAPVPPLPSPFSPLLLSPVVCLLLSSPDVTGARNNGEVRRLHEPVPHGERRREYDAVTLPPTLPFSLHHHHRTHWRPDTFSCVPGASHGRGLPEDPQRGGEEEEEGGEEERNQEGPSHLTITHRAIARYRCASAEEKDVEEGKE